MDPLLSLLSPPSLLTSYGPLHPGALWKGTQQSGRSSYTVSVKIDYVDLGRGKCGGVLRIEGLTKELGVLRTYWEGECVGFGGRRGRSSSFGTGGGREEEEWEEPPISFETKRWGATIDDDQSHWSRFPQYSSSSSSSSSNLTTEAPGKNGHIFMRWKEQFVISSNSSSSEEDLSQNINGASFAGFYFLCLDLHPPSSHSSSSTPASPPPRRLHSPPPSPPRNLSSSRLSGLSYAAIVRGSDPSSDPQQQEKDPLPTPTVSPERVMIPLPLHSSEIEFPPPSSPPMGRGRSGFSFDCSREERREEDKGERGMWSEARITGWYFFKHSEPFQELELRYAGTEAVGGDVEVEVGVRGGGDGRREGGGEGIQGFEFL